MNTRRFYILTEITADVSDELSQEDIRRSIHQYLDKDNLPNMYEFYVQNENRLSVTDEKGLQV